MNQENNNGLKPINASLIPGVSILKSKLRLSKGATSVIQISHGPTRSDEHNRRVHALAAKLAKVEQNFTERGLIFSANKFALDAVEKAVDELGAYIGFDANPKA
jgi:hypothetical protein